MLLTIYGNPERYMESYWKKFPDRFYTGDYAIKDSDGYFWVLGRADEVLKIAGHRIGTIELENAAVSHPAIAEAAVVGKAYAVKGETIVTFAILREGFESSSSLKDEIKKHYRRVVGPVAIPEEVYFVNRLPKTRSGKIMRRVLRALASETDIGDVTTLEDEASVDEVKKAYDELKKGL